MSGIFTQNLQSGHAVKGRAVRTELERTVRLQVKVDEQALQQEVVRLGWQVLYATNAFAERLPWRRPCWLVGKSI